MQFIINIRLLLHGESNEENSRVNLIDMTLILPEIPKISFCINGHQRFNNGICYLIDAHFNCE